MSNIHGGWSLVDPVACPLPQQVATAFSKAIEDKLGAKLTPVMYLGEQLVSGHNYSLICHSLQVTNPPVAHYIAVVIYADLDGNCTITSHQEII